MAVAPIYNILIIEKHCIVASGGVANVHRQMATDLLLRETLGMPSVVGDTAFRTAAHTDTATFQIAGKFSFVLVVPVYSVSAWIVIDVLLNVSMKIDGSDHEQPSSNRISHQVSLTFDWHWHFGKLNVSKLWKMNSKFLYSRKRNTDWN